MPWREVRVQDERLSFVIRAGQVKRGEFRQLCREYGITPPTGYKWLNRGRDCESLYTAMEDHSRRPHRSPNQTPLAIEEQVIAWSKREGWGGKKVVVKLQEEGITLPVITANRILKRYGLVNESVRQPKAVRRFERSAANELVQMDFKGDYGILEGRCYPLTLVDDHSRYTLGAYALTDQRGQSVQRCLIETFERCGVPESMLMDHGTPWWSTTNFRGLTWLSVWMIKHGIQLTFSGVRHPQTQGKIEQFHRTLKASLKHHGQPNTLAEFVLALARFQTMYNFERPHEGIAMAYPASRYRPSDRAYQPKVKEWEYPEGALVKRLNSQGMIRCPDGKRRFVCEALANEWVQVEEFDQRWLIKYRHQYVREIDIKTGRTLPPVRPVLISPTQEEQTK